MDKVYEFKLPDGFSSFYPCDRLSVTPLSFTESHGCFLGSDMGSPCQYCVNDHCLTVGLVELSHCLSENFQSYFSPPPFIQGFPL